MLHANFQYIYIDSVKISKDNNYKKKKGNSYNLGLGYIRIHEKRRKFGGNVDLREQSDDQVSLELWRIF